MRTPYSIARAAAEELVEFLRPACEPDESGRGRIEIAGSLRRQQAAVCGHAAGDRSQKSAAAPDVGGIEIVCVPADLERRAGLFGDPEPSCAVESLLADRAGLRPLGESTVRDSRFAWWRPQRWGSRYKRFIFRGIPVDLFLVRPPASWGVIYLLRTGPSDFSTRIVTPRAYGGALPEDFRVRDGELTWRGEPVRTRTELDFLRALGLPWIEPCNRSVAVLERYLRRLCAAPSLWRKG